ncbi:carbonic anhydrase 15-like isoform X2 [Agrilus planipennis]|uniref:Carbonic anhydrase 15-like isoform X2 n=1 Tax=Agrilus planipennis TaxID=224129 RepID=A0A1W4X6L3_AGRPL|nr:carbonic anhydrase 15-like isoform X2 [Agrilus planipennis]
MGSTYMQFAIIILLTGQLTNGHHWGYSTEEQAKWKEHYKSCGGHRQSPINIYDATGKRLNPFKLQNYRDPLPGPLMLHNNGHTVVLQIAHPRRGQSVPYITGGWLSKSYQFESLHFHWGERSDFGSEHTFTGKRYPMEMHMVHRNKNYRTMEEAMKHADGLMVLAFFYELNKFRSMFGHDTHTKLTNNFRYVQDIGSREVIARIPRIKPPRPIFKP